MWGKSCFCFILIQFSIAGCIRGRIIGFLSIYQFFTTYSYCTNNSYLGAGLIIFTKDENRQ
ncbi:MAG: hypothetical protein BGO39_20845 [Chloroflexi bacterium 54-19]|nr:MAG: hypothetical protein BGO39_20845 [Chloroflexi bacterium 54-19]